MHASVAAEPAVRAHRPAVTFGLFVVLCLLWGLTYTAVKAALHDASPLALALTRSVISIPPTLALALAFGGRFPRDPGVHRLALFLGLCNGAGLTAFINLGAAHVSSGEASLIVYTQPLLVAVAARLWLGERWGAVRGAGLLIGFVGLIVVLADSIRPGANPAWFAYLELFGASLAWTAGTLLFKRVPPGASLLWLVCLQNLYGTVPLVIPFVLVRPEHLNVTPHLVFLLTVLAVVIGPFGWLIWLRLLERGEASVVSGNIFFVPLVAVLGGVFFLGERLHPLVIAGGLLIALGIAIVNRSATSAQPGPFANASGVDGQMASGK